MRTSSVTRPSAAVAWMALALVLASTVSAQEVRYGPPAPLGDGTARTYIVVDASGAPVELGVALSETALQNLPDLADKPLLEAYLVLDLAFPEVNPTPYRFAMLDWNPRGHPPTQFYAAPHFDFHFYLVDPAVRDAIVPDDPADMSGFEVRGSKAPEEGFLPASYVYPGEATVPRMGGHWIDPASHEFHGQPFDTTFLYGTWDGQLIFHEPMMTKAYIESRPDATIEIATPVRTPSPGWYPSAYRVAFDEAAGEHRIALTGFSERK